MSTVSELFDQPLVPIVEAALFAADQPLSVKDIQNLFVEGGEPSKESITAALEQLEQQCEHRGVELVRSASGYQYRTKERYATWVGRMFRKRPPRLSRAALETLAIIAYRQPVTRGDIEEIRGVSVSSETIRGLVDKEWVRELGHRDTPGRPSLYGTSKQFLDFFGLTSLRELPPLDDRRELEDIAREMNIQLWPEENEELLAEEQDEAVTDAQANVEGEALGEHDEALAADDDEAIETEGKETEEVEDEDVDDKAEDEKLEDENRSK